MLSTKFDKFFRAVQSVTSKNWSDFAGNLEHVTIGLAEVCTPRMLRFLLMDKNNSLDYEADRIP